MFGRRLFSLLLTLTLAGALAALLFWPQGGTASLHDARNQVRPGDTIWTIAESHYGGDVRGQLDRIVAANHLHGYTIVPGQTLVLP